MPDEMPSDWKDERIDTIVHELEDIGFREIRVDSVTDVTTDENYKSIHLKTSVIAYANRHIDIEQLEFIEISIIYDEELGEQPNIKVRFFEFEVEDVQFEKKDVSIETYDKMDRKLNKIMEEYKQRLKKTLPKLGV